MGAWHWGDHWASELSSPGTGWPVVDHCSCWDLKALWVWHLGTWVIGGLGSAEGVAGLGGLRRLFQPKQICGSVIWV